MKDELRRAAFARLDRALQNARAALEPGPGPECDCRWEYDQDGGSWACQNCGAVHPGNEYPPAATPAPEPEPYVEIGPYRFTRIEQFQRGAHARWCVCGWCAQGYVTPELVPDETPFSIWQAAVAAGVPCPEPPSVTLTLNIGDEWLTLNIGDEWQVFAITSMAFSPLTGNTCIGCYGKRPQGAMKDALDGLYVTESPAAIRAACAEAGVPCVAVTVRIDDVEWTSIDEIAHTADGKTQFWGEFDGREPSHHSTDLTPAQVCQLAESAGWPKPEVRCVFTFANGDPCEVDPASVCSVDAIRLPGERSTLVTCDDGSTSCFVREPVAVVQRMIDACKEGE